MPSSSLVEVDVEAEVEVRVGVGVEVRVEVGVGVEDEVGVEVEVEVGGVRVGLTCSHVYYFHGWVGGVEKSRIELTSAKLG